MCGIMGYAGGRPAAPILIEGLGKLEYRGYDSAGIAVWNGIDMAVMKSAGALSNLAGIVSRSSISGSTGIGHTRWATHGRPSCENAHPQVDCSGRIVLVHNGIIENHAELREQLISRGHVFRSETDTEVLPHLIEECSGEGLEKAVRRAVSHVRGSYALAVMDAAEPGLIVAVRKDSPLVVGLGHGENFVASDIPALLGQTRRVHILADGEMASVRADGVHLQDMQGNEITRDVFDVTWNAQAAERGGYAHFMLKEIHEQPTAIRNTLAARIDESTGRVNLAEAGLDTALARSLDRVIAIACGTASYAGQVGMRAVEELARAPAHCELASEFRYSDPLVDEGALAVVISQSGETADTLAGLREAVRRGANAIAITNVVGSTVAREASRVVYTWAGPEIAVASTKAYTAQLIALYLLAVDLGAKRGTLGDDRARALVREMCELPSKVEWILGSVEQRVRKLSEELVHADHAFFIGRGLDFASAMEGALKMKEVSYIHAEAYPAGELKHGPLALVSRGTPVFALCTQERLAEKMLSNVQEAAARGARVIAISMDGCDGVGRLADEVLRVPRTDPLLAPVLTVVPMQLLAYYAACARGTDVDKPRNLAKCVTVE
ncbi:MAG: glutamine--fructose-6-phosphate transaminase (isomerizing) [Clostridia bacterium]|nr:glutamine--fructose-6-phosphate transaminase (isomerizing) [Clostridia bacterium]